MSRRIEADASSRETLAHVVVGLAFEGERDASHEERSERLTCRPLEVYVNGSIGQSLTSVGFCNLTGNHGSDSSVGVDDVVMECYVLMCVEGFLTCHHHIAVEYVVDFMYRV